MFTKLIVANRGEIACRIIETAQKMGITTVAIFSSIEPKSKHVQLADEAYCIEAHHPREVYQNGAKIIELAQKIKAQAIHPGYGFLSENADFAQACADHDLIFVGPSAQVIAQMGHKGQAKEIMHQAGIPIIQGLRIQQQPDAWIENEAQKIGYPLLLKAAQGGGGKGMRIVHHASQLLSDISTAKAEAKSYFGDDELIIEKYLEKPRHIEVQVLADQQGHCLYLGDRDCSIQRRHQKIVEEAPAPFLSDQVRLAMQQAALNCVQALNYYSAGTLEFLVDEQERFYFMEMNTRLQVEHPVTEMVHNIDLVEWQLRISAGEALALTQSDLTITGHAIEVRVYAEKPERDFMPCTGQISYLHEPKLLHCRIDSGLSLNQEIVPYYDPMLSKVIAWGASRKQAIQKLTHALSQYQISGCTHNLHFLAQLIQVPSFIKGDLHTKFIEQHTTSLHQDRSSTAQLAVLFGGFIRFLLQLEQKKQQLDPWQTLSQFRLNSTAHQTIHVVDENKRSHSIKLTTCAEGFYAETEDVTGMVTGELKSHSAHLTWQDRLYVIPYICQQEQLTVHLDHTDYQFAPYQYQQQKTAATQELFLAPMNGTIVTHLVPAGTHVKTGDHLLVLEAMKMEYTIKAPFDGQVQRFYFDEGEQVTDGSKLLDMEALS